MNRRTFLKLCMAASLGFFGCLEKQQAGFLRVYGKEVITASGKPVRLAGFNVGYENFREGSLTEEDIKRIAEWGANSLRLWMDYKPFEYKEDGFELLDKILSWCEKHKLYVILDMHFAPGGQNPYDFVIQREGTYEFWDNKEYQQRFIALWAKIAKRCAGREIIAGYDLLNEGAPPDVDTYARVMGATAEAIRSNDSKHIIILEDARLLKGSTTEFALVRIEDKNTMYSIHVYYPHQLTHYLKGGGRAVVTYPGEIATAGEFISQVKSQSANSTASWQKLSLGAAAPANAEIVLAQCVSANNSGAAWFDDLELKEGSAALELPAPLVSNPSFEAASQSMQWRNRSIDGSIKLDALAHAGRRSVKFEKTSKAFVESAPIKVSPQKQYSFSAWVKTENATGDNYIALSWHKKKILERIDKAALEAKMQYAVDFMNRCNVPIYVGEFGSQQNPAEANVANWISDVLELFKKYNFSWSYWQYFSPYPTGFGITSLAKGKIELSRPEILELLRKHF
ncbi:MAG: cellulase family glycosylhydrolase [Euryarchaeota archaeon]|nr:cellulase family glycosylhydrolase [Euryarchaeota archaeon]